jgi:hypothetical protein
MIPVDRSLLAIVIASATSSQDFWPAKATGKYAHARRLRAVAKRSKKVRR